MIKKLLVIGCAILMAHGLFGGEFKNGDSVILTRDAPIYRSDPTFAVVRTAKKGETFQVLRHDVAAHKVYIASEFKAWIKEDALATTPTTTSAPSDSESSQLGNRDVPSPAAAATLPKSFVERKQHEEQIGDAEEAPPVSPNGTVPCVLAYYQHTLKDYYSARFISFTKPRLIATPTKEHKYWVVTVTYNAKNSYGAYTGETRDDVYIQNGHALLAVPFLSSPRF
jgi:uncharacterized protein YgiM (DUF1202 family)